MSTTQNARPRQLAAAGLLAGVAGLAILALGWWIVGWEPRYDWDRLTDVQWWIGGVVRGLSYLAFTKSGLKAALVLVAAIVGAVAWLRSRGKARSQQQPDTSEELPANEEQPAGTDAATDSTDWPRPPGSTQAGSA
ncbi:hypothetical protein [Actinoplanes sp. NPDC051859]|uniref:hypothetical protein n=1 Tax=Actinoplanes sp. NPDC051859 TaxID=3363909 RepID=UPI0037B7B7E0